MFTKSRSGAKSVISLQARPETGAPEGSQRPLVCVLTQAERLMVVFLQSLVVGFIYVVIFKVHFLSLFSPYSFFYHLEQGVD